MNVPSRIFRPAYPFALAGLLVAGAAALPMVADAGNDPETKGSDQPVTDTWITTKVKTELAATDTVKSMDIDVKTVDGVVTLSGVLSSDIAVQKAVAAANSVKGVKSVDASGLKAGHATSRR
jgi:hyperosmotically inducible protein